MQELLNRFGRKLFSGNRNTILTVLLVLFLVFDVTVPSLVAEVANSNLGKLGLVVATMPVLKENPILGLLMLFAVGKLVLQSGHVVTPSALRDFLPSESNKDKAMRSFNQPRPTTLEENIIASLPATRV